MANLYPSSPVSSSGHNDVTITGPDLSIEASFQSPPNRRNDLLSQMRGNHHRNPKTPLVSQNASRRNEFTPLLRSATRPSFQQSQKRRNYVSMTPPMESQEQTSTITDSMVDLSRTPTGPDFHGNSVISFRDSLPRERGIGIIASGGNAISLKEQELKIDKLEKENFALKLKIHFLEKQLDNLGDDKRREIIETNVALNLEVAHQKYDIGKMTKELKKLRSKQQSLQDDNSRMASEYRRGLEGTVSSDLVDKLERRLAEQKTQLQSQNEEMRRQKDKIEQQDILLAEQDRRLQSQKAQLREISDQSQAEVQQSQLQVDTFHMKLAERDSRIESQLEQIEDLELELQNLRMMLQHHEGREDVLSQKDEERRRLGHQVEELKSEIEQLRTENSKLDRAASTKDRKLSDERETNDQLRSELDLVASSKEETIQKLREQMSNLQKEIRSVQAGQSAGMTQAERQFEEAIESKEMEASSLRQEVSQLNRELSYLNKEFENLKKVEQDLREDLDNKDNESHEQRRETALLNREISTLQAEIEALSVGGSEAEKRLDKVRQASAERLRQMSSEKDAEIKDLQRELDRINDLLEATRENLQRKEEELYETEKKLQKQQFQARVSPPRGVVETGQLRAENEGLKRNMSRLESDNSSLVKEAESAQSRAEKTQSENSKLRERVRDVEMQLGRSQTELESLQRRYTVTDEALQELKEAYGRREKVSNNEKERLQQRANQLEKDIHALQTSAQSGRLEEERSVMLRDQVVEKSRQINSMQSSLDQIQSVLDEKDHQLSLLQAKYSSLSSEKSDIEKEVEILESALNDMDLDQNQLQEHIFQLQSELSARDSSASNEQTRMEKELREIIRERDTAIANITEIESRIQSINRDRANLRLRVTELETKLSESETAVAAATANASAESSEATNSLVRKLQSSNKQISTLRLELSVAQDELVEAQAAHSAALLAKEAAAKRHAGQIGSLEAELVAREDELARVQKIRREEAQSLTHTKASSDKKLQKQAAEIRILVRQAAHLKTEHCKLDRLRQTLVQQKKYMAKQVQMYDAYNKEDLRLLDEIGTPARRKQDRPGKKPVRNLAATFRSAIHVVMAIKRMERLKRGNQLIRKGYEKAFYQKINERRKLKDSTIEGSS